MGSVAGNAIRLETGSNYTKTLHTNFNEVTDPSKVNLASPYVVCVVGASRNIGAKAGEAYALAGASKIFLAARTVPDLEQVRKEIEALGTQAEIILVDCDISSDQSVAALAETIRSEAGRLDTLIVNSGIHGPNTKNITDGAVADYMKVLGVNVIGTYLTAHYLIPLLLNSENGAKMFVAVSSLGAWITDGIVAQTAYNNTKFSQVRFVEQIANQFKADGLLSVAVHPGIVKTELTKLGPPEWASYSVDDAMLCGAFCTWLSKNRNEVHWMNGRFLSATWDVDELVAKKDEIVRHDLLKAKLAT